MMKVKGMADLAFGLGMLAALSGCTQKAEPVSNTVLWMNGTYGIITELNEGDYTLFGGYKANEENKAMQQASLEEWWGVTDRASADETVKFLLDEGHRTEFADIMTAIDEIGGKDMSDEELREIILEAYQDEATTDSTLSAYRGMYAEYGAEAIDAWDYARAISLYGWYYIAGYYEKEEALDAALEVANTLQSKYSSWDEMMASYLRGYEYWSGEGSADRQAIYESLKADKNSPYSLLDWNMELTKDWAAK